MNGIGRVSTNHVTWVGLAAALLLVVLMRTVIPFGAVFRNGAVWLVANDPYAFRYMVDQLLASGRNPFNPIDYRDLPGGIGDHDVAFVLTLWLFADLLGGSQYASGLVFAWYPVVSAVLSGLFVYLIAVWVTADRRVGILAVVILALTPGHVYRTMLGFGDHDAFGYVAVMVTAASLVWLLRADAAARSWRDPWYPVAVIGAGIGIVAAVFGWRGGPFLIAPIALFAVVHPVLCVKHGRSPVRASRGLVVALVVGSSLSLVLHLGMGWVEPYRGFAPPLLLGMVVALVVMGWIVYSAEWPWPVSLVVFTIPGVWGIAMWYGHPMLADAIRGFREYVSRPVRDVGESVSLFATLGTQTLMFGLLLLVAVPTMLWIARELLDTHRPAWLLVSAYAWGFLAMATLRYRWSALAAMFVVVFAAVGIRFLFAWRQSDQAASMVSRQPWAADRMGTIEVRETGRSIGLVAMIVVLVMAMGLVQLPGTMNTLTHDDATHDMTSFVADYSAENGVDYPDNFVFTEWGSNRAINYHVSGESRSYGFARSHYRPFVSSSDPDEWDDRLEEDVGFIVVQESRYTYPADSMQIRLNERYGSAGDGVDGLSRYQLVYLSEDRSITVFRFVPGATINGSSAPDTTVHLETEVTVGDETFTYDRSVDTDADGNFSVTVPYPGEYTTEFGAVTVEEADVEDGETVRFTANNTTER